MKLLFTLLLTLSSYVALAGGTGSGNMDGLHESDFHDSGSTIYALNLVDTHGYMFLSVSNSTGTFLKPVKKQEIHNLSLETIDALIRSSTSKQWEQIR